MSVPDNYLKILDKITNVVEGVGILTTEVRHLKEDFRDAKVKLEAIEEQDILQNRLLDEHIRGVTTTNERLNLEISVRKEEKEVIRQQLAEIDSRLKKAEFIPTLLINVKTALVWLASLATAILILGKLFNKL